MTQLVFWNPGLPETRSTSFMSVQDSEQIALFTDKQNQINQYIQLVCRHQKEIKTRNTSQH